MHSLPWIRKFAALCALLSAIVLGLPHAAHAAEKTEFKVAWSIDKLRFDATFTALAAEGKL